MTPPIVWRDGSWHTTEAWSPKINGVILHIPAGFPTDLASIPKPVRGLLDKEDLRPGPAIIHDAFYVLKGRSEVRLYRKGVLSLVRLTPDTARVTRRAADRIFRDAMRSEGVGWVKRNLAWAMVRSFGWVPWPPSRTTLRNVTTRALHSLWQASVAVGVSVWVGWPLWTIPPMTFTLSAAKTLVQQTPLAEQVKDTLYR